MDVYAIAISSNGQNVASVSQDCTARVWDMRGKEVRKYTTKAYPMDVEFLPDQRHLIVSSKDKTLSIIDWYTGSLVETLVGHGECYWGVDVLPMKHKIVSASNKTLDVWSRQMTVIDKSPKIISFGYSFERTLAGHEVRARLMLTVPW